MIDFQRYDAIACIRGDREHPGIGGKVLFYGRGCDTLVVADLFGLPKTDTDFFAFHIHEGESCAGEDFSQTAGHFDPTNMPHPLHAGDLPTLLASRGRAYLAVRTGRFRVRDVLGKTVVIHENPDDFRTQPAGDAGKKIACGVIRRNC